MKEKFNELLEKAAKYEGCHPNFIMSLNTKRNSMIRKTIKWHLIKHMGFKHTDFKTSIYDDFKLIEASKDSFVNELKNLFLNN